MNGFTEHPPNGVNGTNRQDGDPRRRRKIPSISEALPYAPFTSFVPFDSDLIPVPSTVPTNHVTSMLQPEEQRAVKQITDVLDHEATVPGSTSALLARTLGDVKQLLDEVVVPNYKFRVPPLSHYHPPTSPLSQQQEHNNSHRPLPPPQLKPFAKMVLSSTDIPFRYLTPVSPDRSEIRNGCDSRHISNISSTRPFPESVTSAGVNGQFQNSRSSNHQAQYFYPSPTLQRTIPPMTSGGRDAEGSQRQLLDGQSGRDPKAISMSLPAMQPVVVIPPSPHARATYQPLAAPMNQSQALQPVTPQRQPMIMPPSQQVHPTTPRSVGPVVVVPQFPSSSDPRYPHQHPNGDVQQLSSRSHTPQKRKRNAYDADPQNDRQAHANALAEDLQNLLVTIFEAEDQLEPDTSGVKSETAREYFDPASLVDGRQPAPTCATLTSVEEALAGVIAVHKFSEVPVEQVAHLQRLCLSSIGLANGLEVAAPDDGSDTAIEGYIERIKTSDNGLHASELLLRIMTSGRDEKQLYSEDLLLELLANLQNSLENCVMPLVEKRTSSSEGEIFQKKPECQTSVVSVMQRAGQVIKYLGDLVLTTGLSEAYITTIEFLTIKLLFLENASSDKESLFGTFRVEVLRRHAMDCVAKIFLQCPAQRQFIFGEVLSSLEKLPVTRQSARQFKVATVKPIQLVSALIMQLVQTSTMSTRVARADEAFEDEEAGDATSSEHESEDESPQAKYRKKKVGGDTMVKGDMPLTDLNDVSKPLLESAQTNAAYVMRFLVQRAMNSTKSGDQPYRHLLEIFTEDFLNVVTLPAWPAAEVLLRALLSQLFGIINNAKSSAPAKHMALDLMGSIGSTIADLRSHITLILEKPIHSAELSIPDLSKLCQDAIEGNTIERTFFDMNGPYRLVVEHIGERRTSDLQSRSARCFHIVSWAQRLTQFVSSKSEDQSLLLKGLDSTVLWLTSALTNPDEAAEASGITSTQSMVRLCYIVTLLTLPLFKAFTSLLNILLTCLTSPQATLRSRSLKSVIQLLEKDPSMLDLSPTVISKIIQCTHDTSPLVRDSALTLVGKCISLRPALGTRACKSFIERSVDASIGVRKRALKLLGDAYLREKTVDAKAAIADAILTRLNDIEDTITDLASQTIEDIWLAPFRPLTGSEDIPLTISRDLERHTDLIVATAKRGDEVIGVLVTQFRTSLRNTTKQAAANRVVCKAIVNVLFDCIIDNDQTQGRPPQKDCLCALTVFAKADPQLFIAEQMTTILPYIKNLATNEDLLIYRWVVIIYRRVLSVVPLLQWDFLLEVQDVLIKTVQKLTKNELGEVAMCLWIINGVLQNTQKLVKLTLSVLRGIEGMKNRDPSNHNESLRMSKYLTLAGHFGKACDFESERQHFKNAFPSAKFDSVSGLMVDLLLPWASPGTPLIIRENALEAISLICQSWPREFQRSSTVFQSAFSESQPDLQNVILSGVRAFYIEEEARSKGDMEPSADAKDGKERLGHSMVLSDKDSASTGIAHQFLPHILRIALSRLDNLALTATDIITSINRQGLVHPKEIIAALVALETSPKPLIAKIALEEHRDVHAKHESMLDKEYLNAIEQAFAYQATTVGSVSGLTTDLEPKLGNFFDVMKAGSITCRKKFYKNLSMRLEDLASLAKSHLVESRLPFARFVLENIGLFDYSRTDELLQLIEGIEKAFNTTGSVIAQHIETLLAQTSQASMENGNANAGETKTTSNPDLSRLPQLTRSAMVLSMLWETRTHLRRAWGLQKNHVTKGNLGVKDGSKAPIRSSTATAEGFLANISLINAALVDELAMMQQCRAFLELMNVDAEHKALSDEDMEDPSEGIRLATPSDNGTEGSGSRASMGPPSSRGGRKQRLSLSAASTPSKGAKKKNRPSMNRRRSSKSNAIDDDDDQWN